MEEKVRKYAKPVEPKKKTKKSKPSEPNDGKLVSAAIPEPVGAGVDIPGTAS
jgi:hypothetical protein